MHTAVYEQQEAWSSLSGDERTDFFVNLAKSIKHDTAKFKSDMSSNRVTDKISYDQAIATRLGLNSTPTFYLDGKKLDPSLWSDASKLKDAINQQLKNAGLTPPQD